MIEKILIWILVRVFNKLKAKYKDGNFRNLAIVEVDKLDEEIRAKLDYLTPEETTEAVIKNAKDRLDEITEIVKNKITGGKK